MSRILMVVALLAGLCSNAVGVELTMPETMEVGGNNLVLNGVGLRTKFFVKVYAGGLYLTKQGMAAAEVVAEDEPMLVRMEFIYDGVSAEKMQSAWEEGFAETAATRSEELQQGISTFIGLFDREVKAGEVYEIAYLPGTGTDVRFGGASLGSIPGISFKQALFGIWFGDAPVDDDLKEGMLGAD